MTPPGEGAIVRLPREELAWLDRHYYTVLADLEHLGLSSVALRPPASGPEVELHFDGPLSASGIVEQLRAWGYTVLASKEVGDGVG